MNPQQKRTVEVLISTFGAVEILKDGTVIDREKLLEIILKANSRLKKDFPQIVKKMEQDD